MKWGLTFDSFMQGIQDIENSHTHFNLRCGPWKVSTNLIEIRISIEIKNFDIKTIPNSTFFNFLFTYIRSIVCSCKSTQVWIFYQNWVTCCRFNNYCWQWNFWKWWKLKRAGVVGVVCLVLQNIVTLRTCAPQGLQIQLVEFGKMQVHSNLPLS